MSSLAAMPMAKAAARLWSSLENLYPALRSEEVQVLVLLVAPLILILIVLLADLTIRRKVLQPDGQLIFRPSLAVCCAWALVIVVLWGKLLAGRDSNVILIAAHLLASFELLRTFPRSLKLADDGIHWHSICGPVTVPWEQIACFGKERSLLGAQYRLCGDHGQTFLIDPMVLPSYKRIVRRISLVLAQRHLVPSAVVSPTILDRLHRLLAPACLLIVILEWAHPR